MDILDLLSWNNICREKVPKNLWKIPQRINVCRSIVKSSNVRIPHKVNHGFLVCTFLSPVCQEQTIVNCCVTFSLQTHVCQTPPVSSELHLVCSTSPKHLPDSSCFEPGESGVPGKLGEPGELGEPGKPGEPGVPVPFAIYLLSNSSSPFCSQLFAAT